MQHFIHVRCSAPNQINSDMKKLLRKQAFEKAAQLNSITVSIKSKNAGVLQLLDISANSDCL